MVHYLEKIFVSEYLSITKAIKALNDGHLRILLVVDAAYKLLGVIADPDIRRAILRGVSFDLPVSTIMIKEPVVAFIDMSEKEILAMMQVSKCYEIPILDQNRKVIGLRTIDSFIPTKIESEVIIMAGGLGTRLKPLTDVIPKPLIPIGGTPILFVLLNRLISEGFNKITLSLNYKGELIKEAVKANPIYEGRIKFVEERKRLGTAGALSLLDSLPNSPFLVMNADLLTQINFRSMLHFHEIENNQVTMAVREETYQVPFGVVNVDNGHVMGIQEKPIYNYFANAGIYVLSPNILELVPQNSYYDMPDLINEALSIGYQIGSFPIHEYWLDIGRHDELEKAQKDISPLFS